MKRLFIYYSHTGSGEVVANKLKEYKIDILKIEPKKELTSNFTLSMFIGGFKGLTKHKDKLKDYDKDISKYDEIIIGSPIWFDRISSPINSVLSDLDFKDKKVSFVLYSGSGEANKATERLNVLFNNPNITILQEPKKNNKELKKLEIYK